MSTVWHDEDIPMLLAAVGSVPIVIDGVNGIGLLDWNDEQMTSDGTRAEITLGVPMLTIQTSAFPGVHIDSTVQVDGIWYTVRERLKYGDSGNTKLFLGEGVILQIIIDGGAFDGSGGIGQSKDGGAFDGSGGTGSSVDGGGF